MVFLPCVNGFGWGLSREETIKNHPVPVMGVYVHVKRRVGSTLKSYINLFCTMKSSMKSSEHKTSNKTASVAIPVITINCTHTSYLIPIQVETIHRFQGSFGHSDWTGRYFTGSVVCSCASEINLVFLFLGMQIFEYVCIFKILWKGSYLPHIPKSGVRYVLSTK